MQLFSFIKRELYSESTPSMKKNISTATRNKRFYAIYMRIVVTGGAGYIGSHVVLDLLDSNEHELLVVDDLSSGNKDNIFASHNSYTFLQRDYSSASGIKAIQEFKPEVCFHFAALKAAGLSMLYPEEYSLHNIRKSFQLIETLSQIQCGAFIFSSSAAVYGEPQYLPLDEKHPCQPQNYYGFTKKLIEDNLCWFSRLGKMNCALLRYFNAAGYDVQNRINGLEHGPNNLIPILMEVLVGQRPHLEIFGGDYKTSDGTCIRDYIHVSDLSRAHLLAMDYLVQKKQDITVNLGAESGYSVLEVLHAAQEVCGQTIHSFIGPCREGDSPHLVASAEYAHQNLAWQAEHSEIKEILSSTWQVYKKNYSL